jgi:hypothetical protein
VTQLAETAVKSASIKLRRLAVDAAGSINSTVPMAISAASPRMETRAGDRNRALGENMTDIFFGFKNPAFLFPHFAGNGAAKSLRDT